MPVSDLCEVLLVTPSKVLVGMAALHPTSEFTEDAMVHIAENLLTDGRSMEHRPAPNLRVEFHQEAIHRGVKIFSEGDFDLGQKGLHILTRRLDQKLTAVFLKVFAEKIETFFNVRDPCFVF
jgi:hypothetical protein